MKKFYVAIVILLVGIFSLIAGKMFNDYKKEQAMLKAKQNQEILDKLKQAYDDETREIEQANKIRLLQMKSGAEFDKDGYRTN